MHLGAAPAWVEQLAIYSDKSKLCAVSLKSDGGTISTAQIPRERLIVFT